MPANRATSSGFPFGLAGSAASTVAESSTNAEAVAVRRVGCLALTSTMEAWPASSKCDSLGLVLRIDCSRSTNFRLSVVASHLNRCAKCVHRRRCGTRFLGASGFTQAECGQLRPPECIPQPPAAPENNSSGPWRLDHPTPATPRASHLAARRQRCTTQVGSASARACLSLQLPAAPAQIVARDQSVRQEQPAPAPQKAETLPPKRSDSREVRKGTACGSAFG